MTKDELLSEGIRSHREKLDEIIKSAEEELTMLRDECPHPNAEATKVAKGNTGNYCPQDDSYWYVLNCEFCGKHWTRPQ